MDKNENLVIENLNKGDFIPLYYQIGNMLKEQIVSGKLTAGYKLPPEETLAKQYGVAKLTMRNALSKLCQEGLIKRYKGKGTFVAGESHIQEKVISLVFDFDNNILPSPLAQIVSGIVMRLNKEGNFRIRIDALSDLEKLLEMRKSGETQIDGIIAMRLTQKDHFVRILHNADIPVVSEGFTSQFNSVEIDNQASMEKAFNYLLELGHEKIGIASISLDKEHLRQRYKIVEELLTKRFGGVNEEYCFMLEINDENKETEREQVSAFLRKKDKPTALLCTADVVALEIISQAPFVGVKIPDELSIVGFDDMEACRYVYPPLTSIRQDYLKHGYISAGILLDKMNDCTHRKQHYKIIPELIIRNSCISPAKSTTQG